ncbi:hypothetical protein [Agrobacterium sp. 10MFCol1.1]|uniref:hypothetical protein n=1 Tax=Agrobacterium sp. 10MFCol1.1 TaxID=1150775 RepID=UPI0003806636|nr:hypothetical protein [Agrobacterium sp. 10MFCol1.1]
MMADMAAAYCGERHVEDFLERVGTSYPPPRVTETSRRKFWYRDDLDRAMNIGAIDAGPSMGAIFRAKMQEKKRSAAKAKLKGEA